MGRLTVLHMIETSGPGGAEQVLARLVERLNRDGIRSLAYLLGPGWLSDRLGALGVETTIAPQRGYDLGWLVRLAHFLRARSVDVVHAHEFAMNTFGSLASRISGVPIVTTVHGKNYFGENTRRRLAYRMVARMSRMVAVSEDIRKFLQARVGVRAGSVTTIYNGIDPVPFRENKAARFEIRAQLGIPVSAPVIGTIGNLYPVKGQVHLLRAAARLAAPFPELCVLVAGRGEMLPTLRREAASLGIDRRVSFLGFREDVARLLQAFDVFALPSLSEGLPVSVLEAMAAARPVVATRVGGLPELLEDGQTGYLVPAESPEELASRIAALLREPGQARQMGQRGRSRVECDFSLDAMVSRYSALYEAGLGERRCPCAA